MILLAKACRLWWEILRNVRMQGGFFQWRTKYSEILNLYHFKIFSVPWENTKFRIKYSILNLWNFIFREIKKKVSEFDEVDYGTLVLVNYIIRCPFIIDPFQRLNLNKHFFPLHYDTRWKTTACYTILCNFLKPLGFHKLKFLWFSVTLVQPFDVAVVPSGFWNYF